MEAKDQRIKIKGALVHFFREGRKGDYYDALNNTIEEILSILSKEESEEKCILCNEHDVIDEGIKVCKYCEHFLRNTYLNTK